MILGSRDAQRGQQAVEDIVARTAEAKDVRDRLSWLVLDTASDVSVQQAYTTLTTTTTTTEPDGTAGVQELYGIINNAGVSAGGEVFLWKYKR